MEIALPLPPAIQLYMKLESIKRLRLIIFYSKFAELYELEKVIYIWSSMIGIT